MKILVVGGGGREHAIIRALKKSPDCGEIWCAPGNGGIGYDATCKNISATDVDAMVAFAKAEAFDYVVVAQDDPLALGMVDALAKVGIPAFGPDAAAACVVLASGGYPVAYEKGKEITGLENGQVPGAADVTVYHAGTAIKDGKLVTNGGRVLGITATAATLPEALKKAYAAADCIHFDKLHRRSDIGARALAAMKAQEG